MKFSVDSFKSILLPSFVVALAAALFVYRRGPDVNYDLLNYHFFNAYSFLSGRHLDIAPAGFASFFNPLANVPSYLLLTHLPFPASAWSTLITQLLSIPAVALLVREVGRWMGYSRPSPSQLIAFLLCVMSPMWWSELGTTFFSSSTGTLVLWGAYLMFSEYSDRPPSRLRLVVAGALFGIAVGLKLTNMLFAVAASIALLYLSFDGAPRALIDRTFRFAIGGVLGVATTLWWNWYLWHTWDSPVFPLYNAIFNSPYYDHVNFRDWRWRFASAAEFLTFLLQSAFGTSKTSEISFADARLLILSALLPGFLLCRAARPSDRRLVAFLLFVSIGFAFWAMSVAYQRYLIPLELLLGLVIWIFVVKLVEQERLRLAVMGGLLALSFIVLTIPDWGHARVISDPSNPFGIELPAGVAEAPARYLVYGPTVSYILPSLHPDSVFFGVGFSSQVNRLIAKSASEPSNLPLRVLAREIDARGVRDMLRALEIDPNSLRCSQFKSVVTRYVVCEL